VLAGNDLLLTDQFDLVHAALEDAVRSGKLPESRLRDAVERVRAVRTRIFGSPDLAPEPVDPGEADRTVGSAANEAAADRIAAASITIVNGELTPPDHRPLLLATQMSGWPRISVEPRLRAALASEGWDGVDLLMIDATPNPGQIEETLARANQADWITLLHFNGVMSYDPTAVGASEELVALADAIIDTGADLSVVSLGSPYVLSRFPRAGTRLCSFSTCAASVRAVVRVLMGTATSPGRLPVQLEEAPPVSPAGSQRPR
jgi:beta-N-acetylhexosaminidase